jgi:acyl dehydratase
MPILTDEHRALVGVKGPRSTAADPVSADMLRRFVQGVMESNPIHWDEGAASRYGAVVAPPLFPRHVSRRSSGSPDPLDQLRDNPDWDGGGGLGLGGLPELDIPLVRILNGGTTADFYQLAKIGDVISSQSMYVSIEERQGRDGAPMVITTIETEYRNQSNELLTAVRSTLIRR